MITARHRRGTVGVMVVGVLALVLTACAPTAIVTADRLGTAGPSGRPLADQATSTAARAAGAPRRVPAQVRRFRSARAHRTVARPVRITIPAIDVASGLQRLGRGDDGTIDVPDHWQRAGWYVDGPKPGQVGPAVILGHVDSTSGPAVFSRLGELRAGDVVRITRADDSVVTFAVRRVERHAKAHFPRADVYLPTLRPTLRLVTCDGPFDAATGHYRDNLVVFATLDG